MSGSRPEDGRAPAPPPAQGRPRRFVHPDRKLEERANRTRGWFFFVSFALGFVAIGVWFIAELIGLVPGAPPEEGWRSYVDTAAWTLLALAGVGLVSGFSIGLLLRLQFYITDLLFLTSVAGLLLGLAVQSIAEAPPGNRPGVPEVVPVAVAYLLLFIAGAAWGLGTAKRLNEQHTLRRIALIVVGWFLVPGVIAFAYLPFCVFLWWTGDQREVGVLLTCILVLLGLPGAFIELNCGRQGREATRRPPAREPAAAPAEPAPAASPADAARATETQGPPPASG
jgi:hypothetical protein